MLTITDKSFFCFYYGFTSHLIFFSLMNNFEYFGIVLHMEISEQQKITLVATFCAKIKHNLTACFASLYLNNLWRA